MPFECDLPSGECIFEVGLIEALEHKWRESQRYGEDLGLLLVRDWCSRHWLTFQRFRRVEHLFGDRRFSQFTDDQLGIWRGRERIEGSLFDLVIGVFECGMENLEFVNWVIQHRLPREEAYDIFTTLDPNCVRLCHRPILERAGQSLVLA
jgi:hypothetical protein